nr:k(+) efflux antiporter 5 [Quercus suber]
MILISTGNWNCSCAARSKKEIRERFYGSLLNLSALDSSDGSIAKMFDRVLKKEFSENDQPEEIALPKAKEIIVSGGKVKACSPDLFNCFGFPSTTMPAMRYGLWEPDARSNTSRLPSLFFTAQPHAHPLTSHSSEKATRIGTTYLRFEIHMIL